MARNSICAKQSYALVAMHATLLCLLHLHVTSALYLSGPGNGQPGLLTSILQPVGRLLGVVNDILPLNVERPARPSLPGSYVNVRQPEPRPVTPATGTSSSATDHAPHDWSYDDANTVSVGPKSWHKVAAKCGGKFQSPIDIQGRTIKYLALPPLFMQTVNGLKTPVIIKNDGASVAIKPTSSNVVVLGGGLPGIYNLTNIHFHWGMDDLGGSEHWMDGKSYPLEMHMVTFNSKYRNLQEAAGTRDGIHVIAVMFEVSKQRNLGLNFCTSKFDDVLNPGKEIDGGLMDFTELLPKPGAPYYRYRGTLTTPPCTENIIWTVYANPQRISIDQLHKFRSLKLGTEIEPFAGANIRPTQPMDDRVIYTNNPRFTN